MIGARQIQPTPDYNRAMMFASDGNIPLLWSLSPANTIATATVTATVTATADASANANASANATANANASAATGHDDGLGG